MCKSAHDIEMNMVEVCGVIATQIVSHNCKMLGHKNFSLLAKKFSTAEPRRSTKCQIRFL